MVLLPIGLLVGASIWAIWRDYRSVEDDAVQEAQVLAERWAEELARHLGNTIVSAVAPFDGGPDQVHVFEGTVSNLRTGILPTVRHGALIPGPGLAGTIRLEERSLLPDVHRPDDVPRPPAWRAEMSGESLRCWDRAMTELDSSTNLVRYWDEFLATDPPAQARANAEIRRLLLKGSDVDLLLDALRREGRIATESGLPLAALGLARLVERADGEDARLVAQSALWAETISPALFDQILASDRHGLPALRDGVERERRHLAVIYALMDRFGGRGPINSSVWLEIKGQRVFAWAASLEDGRIGKMGPPLPDVVFFVPVEIVKASVARWMAANGPRKGEPFRLGVVMEGEPLVPVLVRSAREKNPRVLASGTAPLPYASWLKSSLSIRWPVPTANSVPTNAAVFPVETSFEVPPPTIRPASLGVAVILADPAALFARARSRALLMGSITLGAAVVALTGFLLARRAFHRQLALNEQKSNFVSAVSHELRAPIAAVRLMTENLTRGAPAEPERQREYFGLILQECRRLSSLIENVLDFSRIEQGRKEYDFEPTDLGALVAATVRLMEPVAADHGVRVDCSVGRASLPGQSAVCDGRAIQQALVNLIDNAIKHSPAGEAVTLEVTGSQTVVRLSVTDRGPGIPTEERSKVFERFYRRGSELRRETQGVGIGLSIVQSIVAAHHGRVWMEDAPGGGCRAVVELPATPGGEERRES